jgi:hypothetical protein
MKDFSRAARVRRLSEDDLLVKAQAPIDAGGFRPVIFRSNRIDYLFGFNDEISGITLDDGVTIPVAMPLPALEQKIYAPDFKDAPVLDLMFVTGETVAEVEAIRLSRNFNPAAVVVEAKAETPVEIVVFAHAKKDDRQFSRLRFTDKAIHYFEPHVERPDKETWISLKEGHAANGLKGFYVPMPMPSFMWYLDQAKKEGRATLDITEATRPRDTKNFKLG